jgi:hypothetical protein
MEHLTTNEVATAEVNPLAWDIPTDGMYIEDMLPNWVFLNPWTKYQRFLSFLFSNFIKGT